MSERHPFTRAQLSDIEAALYRMAMDHHTNQRLYRPNSKPHDFWAEEGKRINLTRAMVLEMLGRGEYRDD